ncbi:hypothetical protein EST38_g11871 [Candolleomyces aberdarensis]|uniref:Uncharacterized protein n=1 Tax=Candolleomyces aberdarensis TaxID=2316362 RepID=A0A4Q2D3U2_9AGAR|nr:hypothetical protein EST38_g11871 [Candolleomyces aberdarensis]
MPSHNQHIHDCTKALRDKLKTPFILLGGAAIVTLGSRRSTSDVDILIPKDIVLNTLRDAILTIPGFRVIGRDLTFTNGDHECTLDILTTATFAGDQFAYEDMNPFTILQSSANLKLLRLDFALAVKLLCLWSRTEDEKGDIKRGRDAEDILFLVEAMERNGMTVSNDCAQKFRLQFYQIFVIRSWLPTETVDRLVRIGVRNLLVPWKENTESQKEDYVATIPEDLNPEETDPFTVELESEE